MADELIDTLIIDVELNDSNAEKGIDKLTNSLKKMQSFLSGFDTSSIDKVAKALNDLGKTNLSNLTNALKDLRESLGYLSKPLSKKATKNLENALTLYKPTGENQLIEGQVKDYADEFDEQFADKTINVDIETNGESDIWLINEYLKAFNRMLIEQGRVEGYIDKFNLKEEQLGRTLEENEGLNGTAEYQHAEKLYGAIGRYIEDYKAIKDEMDDLVANVFASPSISLSDMNLFFKVGKQYDALIGKFKDVEGLDSKALSNLKERAKISLEEIKVQAEEQDIEVPFYFDNETGEINANALSYDLPPLYQDFNGEQISTLTAETLRNIDKLEVQFELLKLKAEGLYESLINGQEKLNNSIEYAEKKGYGEEIQTATAEKMNDFITTDIKYLQEQQEQLENKIRDNIANPLGNEQEIDYLQDLINQYSAINTEINQTISTSKTLQQQLQIITKETTNMGYKIETFFKKLGKRFISVLSYRMIRKLIQQIVKMATEGLQNVAQVDDNINQSMSNLLNSFNALKSSFGASIGYFAEMIEPILTPIIDLFTDIMNLVNQFLSALAGNTTYQKAIKTQEDYADALAKTKANATGIDELNTISNETTPDEMYEETEIASGLVSVGNSLNKVFKMLGEILKLLEPIFDIIDAIFDALDPVFELIGGILDLVMEVLDLVVGQITDSISTISSMITDFLGYFKDVCNLFTNFLKGVFTGDWSATFDSLKQIVCDFANFFIHIWNHLVEFLENMINTICGWINKIGSWFGADWNLGVDFSVVKGEDLTIDMFANGGFPSVGELFIANEMGAEMVGTIGGHTAVANNDQIVMGISNGVYEGVLQALQDADTNSNSNINIVVQIDGKDVASRIKLDQGGAVMYRSGV